MSGDVLKNARQGAHLDRAVIGDGFVMLSVKLGHNTECGYPAGGRWNNRALSAL